MVTGLFMAGLVVKETDDRFCIACHLHEEKLKRFSSATPTDLAGLHQRKDPTVGCIDCHGGAAPLTRVKVWTVAGFDTLKFVVGAYAEPTRMRVALGDAECRQCHTPVLKPLVQAGTTAPVTSSQTPPTAATGVAAPGIEASYGAESPEEGRGEINYHAIRDHGPVNVRCVRCHTSHTTDSEERNRFISRPTVQPFCRECHKDM